MTVLVPLAVNLGRCDRTETEISRLLLGSEVGPVVLFSLEVFQAI